MPSSRFWKRPGARDMTILGSICGPHIPNILHIFKHMRVHGYIGVYDVYMRAYNGIWRYMRYMQGYARILEYMGVYEGI